MADSQTKAKRPSRFRKQLILPTEHGSWSWLLVPFFVGTAVVQSFSLPVWLVLIGGLAFFLLRQPATVWLRVRHGRGRQSDGPLALRVLLSLAVVMLLCGAGLLLLNRQVMLWLLLPFAALMVSYLLAARSKQTTRNLKMELVGAAGLALMAPAAMLAAMGQIDLTIWLLWGLLAAQNVLGVFYVRQRIADTHKRPFNKRPLLWSHIVGAIAMGGTAVAGLIPWLAVVPFVGFLLRAIWTIQQPRPIPHIKKFGFLEIGVELLSGLFIAVGYLIF
ncbi:MAG: YwiC-like family protein [Chloroflexi bacterium]|nr:YwiC-like family protein [Chloroflexota bacterium]